LIYQNQGLTPIFTQQPMSRFKEQSDVILDTRTNLIWARNASLSDFPLTWKEALDFINTMNDSKLYGYNDWKLPNRKELYSLMSLDDINPSLPLGHPFDSVFNGYYWTATTCARLPDQAWYIHLGGARVFKGMKYQSYMVWPVRENKEGDSKIMQTGQQKCYDEKGDFIDCSGTGQDGEFQSGIQVPGHRFEANDRTITDTFTNRMWLKDANIYNEPLNWQSAINEIEAINQEKIFGYNNWRLPGIRDLESLTDLGQHSPALSTNHPFDRIQEFYWSSTASAYDSDYAWALYTKDGVVGVGYKKLPEFYLWPMRSIE